MLSRNPLFQLSVNAKLSGGFGLSVIGAGPEELLYGSFAGVLINYGFYRSSHVLNVRVSQIQVIILWFCFACGRLQILSHSPNSSSVHGGGGCIIAQCSPPKFLIFAVGKSVWSPSSLGVFSEIKSASVICHG